MPEQSKLRPAVVVPCFDRPASLRRLLSTVLEAQFTVETDLVVSIDKSEQQDAVAKVAEAIQWPFGELKIICHQTNLGLKQHILMCGDLTRDYDFVVVLEDDLLVAPGFMQFALDAVCFYGEDARIGGISLYAYDRSERNTRPFAPVHRGDDTYFMQFASSWGQVWTTAQWQSFRQWLAKHDCDYFDDIEADFVAKWPATSWKKHYIRYLEHEQRYFVFPYVSLSTNPGEEGTHHNNIFKLFASELEFGARSYQFAMLNADSICYNSRFELVSNATLPAVYAYCEQEEGEGEVQAFFHRYPYRSTFYVQLLFWAIKVDGLKVIHKLKKVITRG